MMKLLLSALLFFFFIDIASAQAIDIPNRIFDEEGRMAQAMPALAGRAIDGYRESDRKKYLDNLFLMEATAGRYADARKSLLELRALRIADDPNYFSPASVVFEIYLTARAMQLADKRPFEDTFRQSFRDTMSRLDDTAAYKVLFSFHRTLSDMQESLHKSALAQRDGRNTIPLPDAVDLLVRYQFVQMYQSFQPMLADLTDEDDQRRYLIEEDIAVKTPAGATVTASVIRPRAATGALPALLTFTIYIGYFSYDEARRAAAHGYASVIAYPRGKGKSPGKVVPYEYDGLDAVAVIDWISRQSWSDGRVGMYGGSYTGFTQWAAAKHKPPALKAMFESVSVAPGIDVPMEGNVFLNFMYQWPHYVASGPWLDDAHYNDSERWTRLNRSWYAAGTAYRALDQIDGTPNPIFRRWLEHPAYDSYWQRMIPYRDEFAGIDIPILATDGFLQGQGLSSFYYFTEHTRYNPRAEHYYVIGPYNHLGAQRSPAGFISGYAIDPVARINIEDLRYQWFDYIFKHAAKPALLADKLNYQVMGANEWKHAPSAAAMANGSRRFHLSAARTGDRYRLSEAKPASQTFIAQQVNFADRSDIDQPESDLILSPTLDTRNAIAFVSEPVNEPTEISGLFSGQLDFVVNKRDMDVTVTLYEWMPDGKYFQLSSYLSRASYAVDRTTRRLLVPGARHQLAFTSGRLTSRKFLAGSRLVVVLGINKQSGTQINYGSGKDVSDETIADGKLPLQVKWYVDSFIDVPIWK